MSRSFVATLLGASVAVLGSIPGVFAAVTPPWDPFFAAAATVADFGPATRPFGVAAGDYDEDGNVDLIIGRTTGNVAFVKGNGNGTFQAPVAFAWKQAFFNAWAFAPGDVNGDGNLDVIWGANAVSPSTAPFVVNDGEVRAFLGNGNGSFQLNSYLVSGVLHNAGTLIADIGTDAGSVTAGDVDGDGDTDVVGGAVDGANSVVKLLRNGGAGVFAAENIISQPTACATPCSPIYFPAISTQNSPWGLALRDADADGDADLFVTDRALYTYLFKNGGSGTWTITPGSTIISATRPNVYLAHESHRAAVGFTASVAAGDVNGDGRADVVLGLQSGTQTPASGTAHDGELVLDVSGGGAHGLFGTLADIGTMARGVTLVDVNGDGALDVIGAEYDGKIKLLRQLPPLDSDGDGVSDYVDNAPADANAPRIDMNTDGARTFRDQLDNDFDTVLGDPENSGTWQRNGDPADPDDDNDGVADGSDDCRFVAGAQGDADGDGIGDACDPLDSSDTDDDGIPDGPLAGDPGYEAALAAAILWSQGDTHFVIRIDALGRLFQNEFTGLMTDAAVSSPATWPSKCQGMYTPTTDPDPGCATLGGGKEVPVTLVTIPRLLWTDPEVITWINDRNDNPLFELGQHGAYHATNTMNGDWASDSNKNFFSCEFCGMSLAENLQLLRAGQDTLLGNYSNPWLQDGGASAGSPKIDWSTSAHQLVSYAPPFNADDTVGRQALSMLGFVSYSSSVFEEGELGSIGQYFTPEGSHHEQFDQFGVFHASADLELEPPDTTGDTYSTADYEAYLQANTDDGGLTTWLIEEVEWSGRPCNNDDRLGTCNGGSNRENNTVYAPRWNAWLQLLDYVNNYPGGVAMTMGEVALARAFDNAPTVANADQADADNDGVGDAIEDVTLVAGAGSLSRNQAGTLSATLSNGSGPLAGQKVTFDFDADGDSVAEQYSATTDASGVATVNVTATRPVGPAAVDAAWDGLRATAADNGSVEVLDASNLVLDAGNPASGQITDSVTVGATLVDSDNAPLAGRTVSFSIGAASASATTDAAGHVSVSLTLQGPAGASTLQASFAGANPYGASNASSAFTVNKEDTLLTLADAVATRNKPAVAAVTLTEADGAALAGQTVQFLVQSKVKGKVVWTVLGTAVTDASGVARFTIPDSHAQRQAKPIRATFAGDASFLGSSDDALAYRQ